MDSRTLERPASPDAVEFVRFCYRRRRVGWPELYDEMCAVANRGLFRGWGVDDLGTAGIGCSLFEMPALASLVARIVAEEHALRLSARAALVENARSAPAAEPAHADPAPVSERTDEAAADLPTDPSEVPADGPPPLRFAGATAGA
jgi:hypothetical protein